MWPWEHLAFGYLLYSLARRARGDLPTGAAAVALGFGTQFPDLVDKPLTWTFGLLPGGTFAHTVFVALPVVAVALAAGRRVGRPHVATGFSVGYLSHLLGDVVYPIVIGDALNPGRFFWPLLPNTPSPRPGLLENFLYYFGQFQSHIGSPSGWVVVAFELALLAAAAGLWVADGAPGIRLVWGVLTGSGR